VTLLESVQPPPRQPGKVAIRSVQQEPILRGSFLPAARAMPDWHGPALVIESGVHTLEEVAAAVRRTDLLLCRQDGCELGAPLLVNVGASLVIKGSREQPLQVRLRQEAGAFAINGRASSAGRHRNRLSLKPMVRAFVLLSPHSAAVRPPSCTRRLTTSASSARRPTALP
jgi:hypothetical protein